MLTAKKYYALFSALLDAQFLAEQAVRGFLPHTPEYYLAKKAEIDAAREVLSSLEITYTSEDWADLAREVAAFGAEPEARKAA